MYETNNDAIEAFLVQIRKSRQLLMRITEHVNEGHLSTSPNDVNWAHVGDATQVVKQLTEVCEFLGLEGV